MRKIDKEIKLNSYLFESINSKETIEDNNELEQKRKFALKRAQTMVYNVIQKRRLYYWAIMLCSCLLLIFLFIILYLLLSDDRHIFLIILDRFVILIFLFTFICFGIEVFLFNKFKQKQNTIDQIYCITAEFQTDTGTSDDECESRKILTYVKNIDQLYSNKKALKEDIKRKENVLELQNQLDDIKHVEDKP